MQAVLLLAAGRPVGDTAKITGVSLQSVDHRVHRSWQLQQVESLHDRPQPGRPRDARELTAAQMVRALRRSPLPLGYRTKGWPGAT